MTAVEEILAAPEVGGENAEGQEMWRRALDAQLHDIIERSLTQTLSNLIASLSRSHIELGDAEWMPQLDVRLSLRGHSLQPVPAFEELRSTLVMSYLNPSLREATTVRSFSRRRCEAAVSQGVFESCAKDIGQLYGAVETLVSRLSDEIKKQHVGSPHRPSRPSTARFRQEWVPFACIEAEDVVPQLTDPEHWRDVFAALREYRKALTSLPIEKSLGCLRISFYSIKTEARQRFDALHRGLVDELQRRVAEEMEEIHRAVHHGREILESVPPSVADMGRNLTETQGIVDGLNTLLCNKKRIGEYVEVLSDYAGCDALAEEHRQLTGQWDAFLTQLQRQGDFVEKKRVTFVAALTKKV